MKTTTFAIAATSLLQLTLAQPFRRHAHQHQKKELITHVETVYVEGPHVIVYVDQYGAPQSTETVNPAPPTATPTPSPPPAPPVAPAPVPQPYVAPAPAPVPKPYVAPAVAPAPAPAPQPYVAPAVAPPAVEPAPAPVVQEAAAPLPTYSNPAPSKPAPASVGDGFGFSYSPYNGDGTCKTQAQVNTDFAALPSDYSTVRVYGTDCEQVARVLSACKAKSMKLFAGVFNLANLNSEVQTIIKAANGDWSLFDTISVGNELVNAGQTSPGAVLAAMDTARGLLKTAGYTGPIVTVDTLVATLAHPELCDKSDYCAVNSHPFFDGNVAASESGKFLTEQISNLKTKLANKNQRVVITETGWPSKGGANKKAIPSKDTQLASIESIKAAFSSNPSSIILFNTYNTMWKSDNPSTFGAEKYWGFLGDSPSG
ncbi:hypothetical protein HYALB_00013785 [Hymenoscyphus albidus]|uniref:Uncharacterized protein n=1 Tax=Hymenoscyphus albidus TaxID=595503 RepID=A0A9N9LZ58_9HELO|nr:hypothetical protein HYALB_00013785 [Hymenoscyphus albidus]